MQSDKSDKSQSQSQRLPVNPRRHKVAPEDRKRVATACNNCNGRRIKCSGDRPCRQCTTNSRECVYPSSSPKVAVARDELQDLRRRVNAFEKLLQDVIPDPEKRQELLASHNISMPLVASPLSQQPKASTLSLERGEASPTAEADLSTSLATESHLLGHVSGPARFQGESSDGALVDHLRAFLRSCLPADVASTLPSTMGYLQGSDIRPLPRPDGDPLWLPAPETMRYMLSIVSTFIQDGPAERALKSGGIYWWGVLHALPSLPSSKGDLEADIRSTRRLAFYQVVLAVACRITASGLTPDRSEPFFARAVPLLGNPLDASHSSIGAVSVLNLMAYYLLQSDRPEASSLYVSISARTALSLGAHRGHVDERGKRIFWTLYILDRELSCLLGRPPIIPEESIVLSLPMDVDSMPSSAGLRAHVELSRISDHITSNLYGVVPVRNMAEGSSFSREESVSLLEQWQSTLPASLQLSAEGVSGDPATCNLHMLVNHLTVLCYRPWLLASAKVSIASDGPSGLLSSSQKSSCISAALHNMRLARHAATLLEPRRLLRSALRFVFGSALCFILCKLIRDDDDYDGNQTAYEIEFAMGLFDREAQAGNTYGSSCATALRELQALVVNIQGGDDTMDTEQSIESYIDLESSWHGFSLADEGLMGLDGETALRNEVLSWMESGFEL